MTAVARRPVTLLPWPVDGWLLFAVGSLLALGVVMVASASVHLDAQRSGIGHLGKHLVALTLGCAGALALWRIPVAWLEKASPALYVAGLVLLAIVFIPGVAHKVNGARRWVQLGGFNVQTSEFMKLFLILYLAGYLVRRRVEVVHSLWGVIKPLLLVLLAAGLLMLQPDFGTTAVLVAITLGMLFLGGAPLWQFGLLIAGLAVVGGTLVWFSPYRMERVVAFLDPWADPYDDGYQLTQALIAFGRGEWTGVGLGAGIQKQYYLPEAHTDFIMAVIGEELGLIGTLTVIALFAVVVWRAFAIGTRAEAAGRPYAAYLAWGIGLWLGLQAFINIGVNVGLLPTKGLTLPFVSYGSNSLIVVCLAVGILLRIHRENLTGEGAPRRKRS